MLRELGKELLSRTLWHTIGRKNLVRLGRFLSNQGRLDGNNDARHNGEFFLQSSILADPPKEGAMCVFDVGANVGEWSRAFVESAQKKNVSVFLHAFEPFPGTFESLRKNLQAHHIQQYVKTNQLALSSEESVREFFALGADVGVNSFYEENAISASLPQHEKVEVRSTTLDQYCLQEKIAYIHLLKIDTEGHDFDVLRGSEQMLRRNAINAIQFEYNHRWIYARHFLRDVFEWVQPFGLRLGKVTPKGIEVYHAWHPELESFRENNYILFQPRLEKILPCIAWWGDT